MTGAQESIDQAVYNALVKGTDYIVNKQNAQGYWLDFALKCGQSDEWITGYIGNSLIPLTYLKDFPRNESVLISMRKAAKQLLFNRHYENGWGYNATTGVDTDSTATCFLFLSKLGLASERMSDLIGRTIIQAQNSDFGFGSFSEQSIRRERKCKNPQFYGKSSLYDGWKCSDPYITSLAISVISLPIYSGLFKREIDLAVKYLEEKQDPTGYWECYWANSLMLGTFYPLSLLQELNCASKSTERGMKWVVQKQKGLGWTNGISIEPTFIDTAFALSLLSTSEKMSFSISDSLFWICNHQQPDGSWDTYDIMRVPPSWLTELKSTVKFRTVLDKERLYCTSTIIHMLSLYKSTIECD